MSSNYDQALVVMKTLGSILEKALFISEVMEVVLDYLPSLEIRYFNGDTNLPSLKFASDEQLLEMIKRQFYKQTILNQACRIGSLKTICVLFEPENRPKYLDFTKAVQSVLEPTHASQILDFLYETMLLNATTIQDVQLPILGMDLIKSVGTMNWFRSKQFLKISPPELFDNALQHGNSDFLDATVIELETNRHFPLRREEYLYWMEKSLHWRNAKTYYWLIKRNDHFIDDYEEITNMFFKHGMFLFKAKLKIFKQIYFYLASDIAKAFKENYLDYLSRCSPENYFWLYQETKLNLEIPPEHIVGGNLYTYMPCHLDYSTADYVLKQDYTIFDNLSDEVLLQIIHVKMSCDHVKRQLEQRVCDKILKRNASDQKIKELLQQIEIEHTPYHLALRSLLWFFEMGGILPKGRNLADLLSNIENWHGYDTPNFKTLLSTMQRWNFVEFNLLRVIYKSIDKKGFLTVLSIFKETKNVHVRLPLCPLIMQMGLTDQEWTDVFALLQESNFTIDGTRYHYTTDYLEGIQQNLSANNMKHLLHCICDNTDLWESCFWNAIANQKIKALGLLLKYRKKEINIIELMEDRNSNLISILTIKVLIEYCYEDLKHYEPLVKQYPVFFDYMARKEEKQQHNNQDKDNKDQKQNGDRNDNVNVNEGGKECADEEEEDEEEDEEAEANCEKNQRKRAKYN